MQLLTLRENLGVWIGVTGGVGGYISIHLNFIPKMNKYGLVTTQVNVD